MEVAGKRIDTDEGGNGDKPEKICEICLIDNITPPATGVCRECREHMCNSCFKDHLKAKSCRHHVLVDTDVSSLPLAEEEEGEVKCTRHERETVRFYCRKHEAVGCGDCMVFEHNACKSEYISNASQNIQQSKEYKLLTSRIDKLASENKENEGTVHVKKRENKLMLEEALGDIRKFRIHINKYLDKVEADVISEAKRIMSDNDKILAKLGQDCELLSSKIDKIKQMFNTEIFKENELFINTVECKPNVSDIENTIAEVQMKKTKTVKFVCDKQLRSIVTSFKKLGTFDVFTAILRRQTTQLEENNSEESENSESNSEGSDETFQLGYRNNSKKRRSYSKKDVQRKEKSESKVVVGSRVQTNWKYWDNLRYIEDLYWKGTVTAVHSDGSVSVMWGDGSTGGPCTVGTGLYDVSLI